MSADTLRLPYRAGVGIMLLDREGRVLVAQRGDMRSSAWQMPQGGIEPGETALLAAQRELREELGTDKAEPLAESRELHRYDLPDELVPKLWGGRFRGQEQRWFAFRFTGDDADIDIATEVPEFIAWRWAPAHELPALAVPFKRALYERLLDEFTTFLPPRPTR